MDDSSGVIPPQLASNPTKDLHDSYHGAICDACECPILGIRWKCISCFDFDICSACEAMPWTISNHPVNHAFLALPRPLPSSEFKCIFPFEPFCDEALLFERSIVHRGAFCCRCKTPITGNRYICLNCPNMRQECGACHNLEPDSKHENGRNHIFCKIRFAKVSESELEFADFLTESGKDSLICEPSLFKTPSPRMNAKQQSQIESPLNNDIFLPFLPTFYTGEYAAAAANPLSRSEERRQTEQNRNQRNRKPVNLRNMTIEDIEKVMQIENDSFAAPFQPDYFFVILGRKHYLSLVAIIESEISGEIVAGYLVMKIRADGWAEVQSIAVARDARGSGIGRVLLESALQVATDHACSVRLHVSVWNANAMALYKSLGFQAAKWMYDYYNSLGEEEDALEMHRLMK